MHRFGLGFALAWLVTLAGCGGTDKCTPGESKACACAGGQQGAQVCGDDGTFAECACTSFAGNGGAGGAAGFLPVGGMGGIGGATGGTGGAGGTGGIVAPKNCPCDKGSYCDLATNLCEVGCLSTPDCVAGQSCDTVMRQCVTGAGTCNESNPISVTGTLETSVAPIQFDSATVVMGHSMDVDAAEDRCLTRLEVTLNAGAGCHLELFSGPSDAEGSFFINYAPLTINSQCPGFAAANAGEFVWQEMVLKARMSVSPTMVADMNSLTSCLRATITIDIDYAEPIYADFAGAGAEPLALTASTLTVQADVVSEAYGPCLPVTTCIHTHDCSSSTYCTDTGCMARTQGDCPTGFQCVPWYGLARADRSCVLSGESLPPTVQELGDINDCYNLSINAGSTVVDGVQYCDLPCSP